MSLRTATLRRGVSLTELLVLLSSSTMILAMTSVLLFRVMRVQIDSRAFVDAERTSARLSRQFRQDVHQATAAELDASKITKNVFLRLQLPNRESIEYGRVAGSVMRTVSREGKGPARDEFAFEPSCKLAIHAEASPKRIILSVTSPGLDPTSDKKDQLQSYKAVPVSLQVEASINRGDTSILSTTR